MKLIFTFILTFSLIFATLSIHLRITNRFHTQSYQLKQNLEDLALTLEDEDPSAIENWDKYIPFDQILTVCKTTSEEGQASALQLINHSIESIKQNDQLSQPSYTKNLVYLYALNEALITNCTQPEPVQKYSNILTNKSWIFSLSPKNTTQSQFQQLLIKTGSWLISAQSNACSESLPFFNGKQCISCPQGTHFHFGIKKCAVCLYGYAYKPQKHVCEEIKTVYVTNPMPDLQIISGNISNFFNNEAKILRQHQGAQLCPSDTPYSVNGVGCIGCQSPDPYFNESMKTCTNCEGGYFDKNLHQCVMLASNSSNSLAIDRIINVQNATAGEGGDRIQCPLETPFYRQSTLQCIDCPDQNANLFDASTGQCTTCTQNLTQLNVSTHRCQPIPTTPVEPVETVEPVEPVEPTQPVEPVEPVEPIQPAQPTEPVEPTQPTQPVEPTQPENTTFLNNLQATNWTSNFPFMATHTYYSEYDNETYEKCPIEKPFVIQNQCGVCPEQTPYYDLDQGTCVEAYQGRQYSDRYHKQVSINATSITNPSTAPNLLYSGVSEAQWKYRYEVATTQDPSLEDCNNDTAYYNGIQCTQCPQDFPRFDLYFMDCVFCEEGTEYNADNRQCLNTQGQPSSPNLEKMMSNVFTHHQLQLQTSEYSHQ